MFNRFLRVRIGGPAAMILLGALLVFVVPAAHADELPAAPNAGQSGDATAGLSAQAEDGDADQFNSGTAAPGKSNVESSPRLLDDLSGVAIHLQRKMPQDTETDTAGAVIDGLDDTRQDVVYGTLRSYDQRDSWLVDVVQGDQISILMERTSSSLDPYLELYNSYGQLRATDDDSGGWPNARLQGVIGTTGTYRIVATSYNSASCGSYRLTIIVVRSNSCSSCPPPPCSSCQQGSVTFYSGTRFSGRSYTATEGRYTADRLPFTPQSLRFNGSYRDRYKVLPFSVWCGAVDLPCYDVYSDAIWSDSAYLGLGTGWNFEVRPR